MTAPTPTAPPRSACRSCSAPVVWATTRNDKTMPVDADPSEDGNIVLNHDGIRWRAVVVALKARGAGMTSMLPQKLHTSHFMTCPNAARHRRG